MKFYFYTFLLLSLNIHSQEYLKYTQPDSVWLSKVFNYNLKTDSDCLIYTKKADSAIKKGELIYTTKGSLDIDRLAYEEEMVEICKRYKLKYSFYPSYSDPDFSQDRSCFSDYMNIAICKKYGMDFIAKLHSEAEHLFYSNTIVENKPVNYMDCQYPAEFLYEDDYLEFDGQLLHTALFQTPKIKQTKNERPWFKVSFIVEKDSKLTSFKAVSFNPVFEENMKLEKNLFEIASNYIENKYPKWNPGRIGNQNVRTLCEIDIYLANDFKK